METKKRRRMEYFNKELQKLETGGQISYKQMEKSIKCRLEKTISKTRIKTNRPSRGERNRDYKNPKKRPEGEKKRIQHCNKEKQKQTRKHESLHTKPGQTKGRNRKRTQREHTRPSQKNQQGRRNKITTFLERKKKITPKQSSNSYITLNESGHPIEDPAEAKEHIAQYFENLYQAREGRPQYAEWTREIKTTLKRITESDEMKEDIDPILTTEVTEAMHKLNNNRSIQKSATNNSWQQRHTSTMAKGANNPTILGQRQKGQMLKRKGYNPG